MGVQVLGQGVHVSGQGVPVSGQGGLHFEYVGQLLSHIRFPHTASYQSL